MGRWVGGQQADRQTQSDIWTGGWVDGMMHGWMDKQRADSDRLKNSGINNQLINRQEDEIETF